MVWIRRQQPKHKCTPPTTGNIPAIGAVGSIGDLWRCDTCKKLWRIADASEGNLGRHVIGKTWKPATLRQRLRYYWAEGTVYPDDITDPPARQTGTDWLHSVEEGS